MGSGGLVQLGNTIAQGGIDTAGGILGGPMGQFIMLGVAVMAIGVIIKVVK